VARDNVREAKAQFPNSSTRFLEGEKVLITRNAVPVA